MLKLEDNTIYYSIIKKSEISIDDLDNLPCFCIEAREETKRAYIVLSKIVKKYLNKLPEIVFNKNGKPYFRYSNLYFNYSHSKNYIALALSTVEVGIDIEETTRSISDIISKKYLDGEKNQKKKIEKWVKKEAYSKLKGLGLLINFQNINLNEISNKNIFISNRKYMCSVYSEYSESDNAIFKEIFLDEELL